MYQVRLVQTLIQKIPAQIKKWFEWEMQKIGQHNQRYAEIKVTIPYSRLRYKPAILWDMNTTCFQHAAAAVDAGVPQIFVPHLWCLPYPSLPAVPDPATLCAELCARQRQGYCLAHAL